MNKKYKISNLANYMKLLKKLNTENYVLRGQVESFYDISASAFRIYNGTFSSSGIYDYPNLIQSFFNKVCIKLTQEEKDHFIAFSQHHSLPTNLIDFTNSPLIALFFSCYNKKSLSFTIEDLIAGNDKNGINELINNKSVQDMLVQNLVNILKSNKNTSNHGVIYLIRKDKTLDITDILKQENSFDFYKNIIVNKEVQSSFYNKLSAFFKEHESRIRPNILNILEVILKNNYSCYYKDNENIFRKTYNKYKRNTFSLHDLYIDLIENMTNENIVYGFIYNDNLKYEYELAARIYLGLLIQLLEIVEDYNGYTNSGVATLDLELYFTYSPPLSFDRIKNQNGIFIYQPYLFLSDTSYDFNILIKQSIIPDITIEVGNQEEMLRDLENISIDSGFVFSDYDHIALSLKNKFILK